jgi:RNA polymerase-binding transcription factor DksA
VACESEINSKRLEAVPWTRYCLHCQERLEQLTNQRAA